MLIAEDLLLLLTDDSSGQLSAPAYEVEVILAGANLVELALMGRADYSREAKSIRFLGTWWHGCGWTGSSSVIAPGPVTQSSTRPCSGAPTARNQAEPAQPRKCSAARSPAV